jgi:Tfp pilus assembly protein PilN
MKKVRIDFAPPGLRRTLLRTPRAAWALLMIALVLSTIVLSTGFKYRQQSAAVERLRARVQVRAARPAAVAAVLPARPPVTDAQASAVNAAVMQLNLPWRALHDAVQAATPPTVALLALEPDAKRSALRITAEARSSDDMIAYVEQLQAIDWFGPVGLVRHEINVQDPNRPIRFQIDARWKAAP